MSVYASDEWAALVRAIRAAEPEDDLPRLVAADWLEERGLPEIAAYIRVKVAFSVTEDLGTAPLASTIWGRQWAAEVGVKPFWEKPFGKAGIGSIRRGFVEIVGPLPLSYWIVAGDKVFARQPVRRVVLATPVEESWHSERPEVRELSSVMTSTQWAEVTRRADQRGWDTRDQFEAALIQEAFAVRWEGLAVDVPPPYRPRREPVHFDFDEDDE